MREILLIPLPTGTCTRQEAPSFAWRTEYYAKESDRVDLLYAILHSHGWIERDDRWVVVRLEPLQQPNRRYAQEQLCRKLTGLGAKIPGGKCLRIEVGDTPL